MFPVLPAASLRDEEGGGGGIATAGRIKNASTVSNSSQEIGDCPRPQLPRELQLIEHLVTWLLPLLTDDQRKSPPPAFISQVSSTTRSGLRSLPD